MRERQVVGYDYDPMLDRRYREEKKAISAAETTKKKKNKRITMAKCFDTPLIPLEVGVAQTDGPLWYILDTRKVGTIKLYITMLCAAITAPVGHPVARKAYMKHIPNGNVPVWMPYREGCKRSNISSHESFQKARDELVEKELIERTDDDSIYIIGRITGENEWKSLLHIKIDQMLSATE